jgi:hypothetical protein
MRQLAVWMDHVFDGTVDPAVSEVTASSVEGTAADIASNQHANGKQRG